LSLTGDNISLTIIKQTTN